MRKLTFDKLYEGKIRADGQAVHAPSLLRTLLLWAAVSALLPACGQGGSPADPVAEAKRIQILAESTGVALGDKDLYVAPEGSDANAGTRTAPLRTIQRAASLARAGTAVHVAPGTYAETIVSDVSGSLSARIIFVSDAKWGARIEPPRGAQSQVLWQVRGGFTDIVGFDLSAAGSSSVRTGIEFTGPASSARNNRVHHIGQLPLNCDGVIGAAIFSASDPVSSGRTDVVGNVVHNIGQDAQCTIHGIYLATSGTIKNNLVYNVGWGAIYLWRDNRNIDVVNNTAFHSLFGLVYGSGDQVYSNLPADYINVANNIFYDNRTGVRNAGLGQLGTNNTFSNNLVSNNTVNWMTSTPRRGDIDQDPQFVNYLPNGGGDYRLRETSPAIDRAVAALAPVVDLNGMGRTQGDGPDIGAYEFIGSKSSPGEEPGPGPTPTPGPDPDPDPEPGPAPTPTANHLYVATSGSDSNDGSRAAPFRTIARAARIAKADTTVHVASGTYVETVTTNAKGKATGRIRFVSDAKWGAKIIGTDTEATWSNKGDYTDIVGFDISGSGRLGIANFASHTVISGNHVHDLQISGGCTGSGGAGIVNASYNGSDGDVIGNVVHDIGIPGDCNGVQGIYSSNLRGRIYNNIVYRASSFGIHLWHAANNVMIANNTVFANGARGVGGGIVTGTGDRPGNVVLNNTKVINNLVFDNAGPGIKQYCYAGQDCIGDNNIVANNLVYGNGSGIVMRKGTATGTITADPQFVDYRANGSGDYRLRGTSPAVNNGIALSAPTFDIDNAARPRGAALDIGAYENH
ncbi:MAG: right-handed parallel beta-helix repeat-containing protein [Telluria sp.]